MRVPLDALQQIDNVFDIASKQVYDCFVHIHKKEKIVCLGPQRVAASQECQ